MTSSEIVGKTWSYWTRTVTRTCEQLYRQNI